MIKQVLTLVTVGMFAAASLYAGDKGHCAKGVANDGKMDCSVTYAKLDLTTDQKSKMDTLAADCVKGGCNEATHAKMTKGAEGILSKEQFAAWKAACDKMSEKTQS